jgi:ubiquinone/menaquinone biosynthesis C-methylase UbiE
MARRGGLVIRLDLSGALLAKARSREAASPLGLVYVHADAAAPEALHGQTFDGVLCSFGLSDINRRYRK